MVPMICDPSGPINFTLPIYLAPSTRYGPVLQFIAPLHQFSLLLSPETWIPYKNCYSDNMYRQLVGSLLYLTHTHPDIFFVFGLVAWYMKTPHESHWKATKRILLYFCGTVQFRIHYSLGGTPLLVGFTNSDWADDPDDQKSTTSYLFSLGSGPVTWACKKQQAIALS
jgi:hypothetical protein